MKVLFNIKRDLKFNMPKPVTSFVIFLIIIITSVIGVNAQDGWKNLSDAEVLQMAKDKSRARQYAEAQHMLRFLLDKYPDDHDIRILFARTFTWSGDRVQARRELNIVLAKEPLYADALHALSDIELWDEQFEKLLVITDHALQHFPNDTDFLFKRAQALYETGKKADAISVLTKLISLDPSNSKAGDLLASIREEMMKYVAGIAYGIDAFSNTFSPAHNVSGHISKKDDWGTSIVRMNYASRFHLQGLQGELDLYPRIYKTMYAYLNYGYSSTSLFPRHRAGVEVFGSFLKRLEASGGLRYLYFNSGNKVEIWTGSVGWYGGSYWISARPFITPAAAKGTGFSSLLIIRKYTSDRDDYFGVNGSFGFSPDDRRLQTSNGLTAESFYNLKSQSVGLDWSHNIPHHFIIMLNAKFSRQQFAFDVNEYINIVSGNISIKRKF